MDNRLFETSWSSCDYTVMLTKQRDWVSGVRELNTSVPYRREVGTRFASLIFANMRLANLVPTSRRWVTAIRLLSPVPAPHAPVWSDQFRLLLEVGHRCRPLYPDLDFNGRALCSIWFCNDHQDMLEWQCVFILGWNKDLGCGGYHL